MTQFFVFQKTPEECWRLLSEVDSRTPETAIEDAVRQTGVDPSVPLATCPTKQWTEGFAEKEVIEKITVRTNRHITKRPRRQVAAVAE